METTATPVPNGSQGLLARAFGVLFSPRLTYAGIVARPRVLGALVAVVIIIAAVNYVFLSTEVGQRALLDQQIETIESFGGNVTDQMLEGMERRVGQNAMISVAFIVVVVPLVQLIMAGLGMVVFNAIMGGDATFKQNLAVVAHGGFIGALQVLFVTPLNYVKESMSSATSLAVFLPMLDSRGFLGMLAGSIDFFRIWSTVSLAIGLAVLYKRRTAPVAWSLLAVYFVIILVVAGVRAAISGA